MLFRPLNILGLFLIELEKMEDERGFFSRLFCSDAFLERGLCANYPQWSVSFNDRRGTLRGLHFQAPPHAQGKLLRVARGSVFDVAVDIRVGSPTYGQHVSAILSAENGRQIWIPAGFAHGYCTLEPNTEVIYKVTDYYAPDCDRGLKWDDAALGIRWPVDPAGVRLSDKDRRQPRLGDAVSPFKFG